MYEIKCMNNLLMVIANTFVTHITNVVSVTLNNLE